MSKAKWNFCILQILCRCCKPALFVVDLLNASNYLDQSDQTWGWMPLNLHHCNYFLGKQDAIGEWPAAAEAFYFSMSIYARKELCINHHLEDTRQHPTLPLSSCPMKSCSYSYLYSYQEVYTSMFSHHSTCSPWRRHWSTATGALCKKGHNGVIRDIRTPPETWRTRSKQLKQHHPYCMQRQHCSVHFFALKCP